MKKKLIRLFFLSAILFTLSFSASAQVYVKIRPPAPVILRTAQPSPAHVWIDEEWQPDGRGYRYVGGHWVTPPQPGYIRKEGYWRHRPHLGEEWVPGSWVRKE